MAAGKCLASLGDHQPWLEKLSVCVGRTIGDELEVAEDEIADKVERDVRPLEASASKVV